MLVRLVYFCYLGDNLLTATNISRQCNLVKPSQQIIFVKAELIESSTAGAQHIKISFKDSGITSEEYNKVITSTFF